MDQFLQVGEGADAGKLIELTGRVTIGRAADADLVLNDKLASDLHAVVTVDGEDTYIEDLGSANGTFVDNEEVHGRVSVPAGGEILIGVTVIRLRTSADLKRQPTIAGPIPPPLAVAATRPDFVGVAVAEFTPAVTPTSRRRANEADGDASAADHRRVGGDRRGPLPQRVAVSV